MTTQQWTITGPQVFDVEHISSLDATIMTGRIDVVAHDDPARTDARVEVYQVDGQPLTVRLEGGTLKVGYEPSSGGWKGFVDRFRSYSGKDSADVYIAVPASAYIKVRSVRADALVAGAQAGARVATVSGPVHTAHTAGALVIDAVSGDVAVSEHRGNITMDSISGALTATGCLEEVKLDTVSGAVTIDAEQNPTLLQVNAVSADVMIRLPEPGAVDYAVRSLSGRLLIDGIDYRPVNGAFKRSAQTGPGAALRMSTVSGNVSILRRDGEYADGWGAPEDDLEPGRAPYGTPPHAAPPIADATVSDHTSAASSGTVTDAMGGQ